MSRPFATEVTQIRYKNLIQMVLGKLARFLKGFMVADVEPISVKNVCINAGLACQPGDKVPRSVFVF